MCPWFDSRWHHPSERPPAHPPAVFFVFPPPPGVECRVSGAECRATGAECRATGVECRVSGVGRRVFPPKSRRPGSPAGLSGEGEPPRTPDIGTWRRPIGPTDPCREGEPPRLWRKESSGDSRAPQRFGEAAKYCYFSGGETQQKEKYCEFGCGETWRSIATLAAGRRGEVLQL